LASILRMACAWTNDLLLLQPPPERVRAEVIGTRCGWVLVGILRLRGPDRCALRPAPLRMTIFFSVALAADSYFSHAFVRNTYRSRSSSLWAAG
jgi:hypothetical protein